MGHLTEADSYWMINIYIPEFVASDVGWSNHLQRLTLMTIDDFDVSTSTIQALDKVVPKES